MRFKLSKQGLVRFSVFSLICSVFLFPFGSFSIFKKIIFLLSITTLSSIFYYTSVRINKSSIYVFLTLCAIFSIALLNTYSNTHLDGGGHILFSSVISGIILVVFTSLAVRNKLISLLNILTYFVIAISIFCVIKVALIVSLFLDIPLVVSLLQFDTSKHSSIGVNGIYRLVFLNDFYVPLAFILVGSVTNSSKIKLCLRALMLIVVLLTLTRYIWLIFVLILIIRLKPRDLLLFFMFLVTVPFVLDLMLNTTFIDSILMRFGGAEGNLSTGEKVRQVPILISEFLNYPYFGKGLGTYVEHYIRAENLKYGYEVYYLSLLLNLGLVLFSILFFLLLLLIVKCAFEVGALFFSYLLCLLLYLGNGFLNPTVLSSSSILFYYLIFLSFLYLSKAQSKKVT